MKEKTRVVVAMSGGVDSAIAAARLHEAGHEVVGVTLHLWDYPEDPEAKGGHARCCAPEDQYDARRMADAIGFPHYTFDRRELFAQKIVAPFVEAYLAGETPSPCTACNRGVKLTELFAIADRLGATYVATGHYARIERDASGVVYLATGVDATKDQSYFLYATPRDQLERLLFPLGESTKHEVRAEAIARNIPGARKGESQELCFVGGGQHAYAGFVEERAGAKIRPGAIVDGEGRVLAQHNGVHNFTIGQRKGLGVAVGKPVFVTEIDAARGRVQLGDENALLAAGAELDEVTLAPGIELPLRATIRVRYRHEGALAEITGSEPYAKVRFLEPVRAVTRGQIAVFYEGDRVLGGGRIARPISRCKEEASGVVSAV